MSDTLRAELTRVASRLGADGIDFVLERPRDAGHGDLATNLAMVLARRERANPRKVAERVLQELQLSSELVERTEIAGPGFINFWLAGDQLAGVHRRILSQGPDYGRSDVGHGVAVNVEFVSANPTGPLHVGHGRQAVMGDAIASLLQWTGYKVSREFYYNDAGVQIANLALSVQGRVREAAGEPLVIPEGGYYGEYIKDIAATYRREFPQDPRADHLDDVRRLAIRELRREQDLDLKALGVVFDIYYLESSLYDQGKVEAVVNALSARGRTYEKEGALWLRTTDYGDDKDRVMRKSDGTYTYFVPDVAYHVTKWERGFRQAINVQGADHHSTVTRVRAGLQALDMGVPTQYPEYVLHQMVTVMKGGEEMKISKRAGSYVTVRDLIDDVGVDAVRYFFLMRKGDSQLVFDVDLAREQTEKNPVFYVQMAHARLSGIFRTAERDPESVRGELDLSVLPAPQDSELLKKLAAFPEVAAAAAREREPHRITTYLHELATVVHGWYHHTRAVGAPEGQATEHARLLLARAARIVLANALGLLGVSAPDRM
ncbi:MAG TPA: arginine--tRNA ligase [Gemmatimonadales bacterium]|nr:arginine--tRNA ligase [Gemmatimonadales bacterium]